MEKEEVSFIRSPLSTPRPLLPHSLSCPFLNPVDPLDVALASGRRVCCRDSMSASAFLMFFGMAAALRRLLCTLGLDGALLIL